MPPPIPPQQQVRPQMPPNALSPMGTMGPQVSQMNPMGKPNTVMQQQQQQQPQQQQQNRVLPGMEQLWNRYDLYCNLSNERDMVVDYFDERGLRNVKIVRILMT